MSRASNAHSLGWRDQLAFRYASRRRRWETLRNMAVAAAILLAYGTVGALDYADEQRQEAARQAEVAERATYALAECLNGKTRLISADGRTAVLCSRAYEVTN